MKIYRHINHFDVRNPILTIGTFDGVHNGHRKLLEQLLLRAQQMNGESVVLTFWPHPRYVLWTDVGNLKMLTTLDEKAALLQQLGVQHLVVIDFNEEFAKISSTQFTTDILVKGLKIKHLVVGYDHRFGNDRGGDIEQLQVFGQEYGFTAEKITPLSMGELKISSTLVREALHKGDVKKAAYYLGYNYSLSGVVTRGKQIGRSIGFRTANVYVAENYKLIPAHGVYAVRVHIEQQQYNAMVNIGVRPTVNNTNEATIEAHIFDFDGDIYDRTIQVEFVQRVRPEQRFGGLEQLKQQLEHDKITVRNILSA